MKVAITPPGSVSAYSQQGRLADGYQALRIAESCAAQDIRRPATGSWSRTWLPAIVVVRCLNCACSAVNWESPRE